MIPPAVKDSVDTLTVGERVELRDYLDATLPPPEFTLTEAQKETIRSRDAEMDADPSIGIDGHQVYRELMAELLARR
ncbi:MAG: addiction module protein [Propionibacteriaceae bacterium]|jgi:hypothetical protein|nr:addiction module protein [Propionibacteriaceae bacterium]